MKKNNSMVVVETENVSCYTCFSGAHQFSNNFMLSRILIDTKQQKNGLILLQPLHTIIQEPEYSAPDCGLLQFKRMIRDFDYAVRDLKENWPVFVTSIIS